jgi:hypothetical protein
VPGSVAVATGRLGRALELDLLASTCFQYSTRSRRTRPGCMRRSAPRRPFSTVGCTATPPAPAPDKQVVLCLRSPGADNAADADTKLLVGPAALRNGEIAEAYRDRVSPQPERPDAAWAGPWSRAGMEGRSRSGNPCLVMV